MKTLRTLSLAIIALMGIVIMPSCKTEGCTNPNAENYDAEADKDCGCCQYSASVVFWYNQSAAEYLMDDDATSLTFYINGQIVGSTGTNVYWPSALSCGSNGSITVEKDLGEETSKTYSYAVKDQTGFTYWNGNITFEAGTCISQQLSI